MLSLIMLALILALIIFLMHCTIQFLSHHVFLADSKGLNRESVTACRFLHVKHAHVPLLEFHLLSLFPQHYGQSVISMRSSMDIQ